MNRLIAGLMIWTLATGAGPALASGTGSKAMAQERDEVISAQAQAGFRQWRESFWHRAKKAGIKKATFNAAFKGVKFSPKVVKNDVNQSEFTRAIWDYLDSAVSDKRISGGRQKRQEFQAELSAIELRYGVDARVVLAIWGMETSYGKFMGDFNVFQAYATLAYDGRRRKFAEQQLIAALRIVQSGDKAASQMTGSWAGAMGHTQFIPTSFEAYAVDFTGDGSRDLWRPPDALASTANYLAKSGWVKGQPWGMEVKLPKGFDYAQAAQSNRKPVGYWTGLGVRLKNGKRIPDYGEAAILVPAGAAGPVFVIFKNFRVIRRYNNAMSYALAVGHLGDRIYGGETIKARWPRTNQPLSLSQTRELQRRLTAKGHSTGSVDGKVGPNTMRAIRAYQRSLGLPPDGYASIDLLKHLR